MREVPAPQKSGQNSARVGVTVVNIVDKERLWYAAFFVYYSNPRSDAVSQIDRMVEPRRHGSSLFTQD
jgi:hypothetical protein